MNGLDPSHHTSGQSDFDTMWMVGRFGKDAVNDAPGEFAAALVVFLNHRHIHA